MSNEHQRDSWAWSYALGDQPSASNSALDRLSPTPQQPQAAQHSPIPQQPQSVAQPSFVSPGAMRPQLDMPFPPPMPPYEPPQTNSQLFNRVETENLLAFFNNMASPSQVLGSSVAPSLNTSFSSLGPAHRDSPVDRRSSSSSEQAQSASTLASVDPSLSSGLPGSHAPSFAPQNSFSQVQPPFFSGSGLSSAPGMSSAPGISSNATTFTPSEVPSQQVPSQTTSTPDYLDISLAQRQAVPQKYSPSGPSANFPLQHPAGSSAPINPDLSLPSQALFPQNQIKPAGMSQLDSQSKPQPQPQPQPGPDILLSLLQQVSQMPPLPPPPQFAPDYVNVNAPQVRPPFPPYAYNQGAPPLHAHSSSPSPFPPYAYDVDVENFNDSRPPTKSARHRPASYVSHLASEQKRRNVVKDSFKELIDLTMAGQHISGLRIGVDSDGMRTRGRGRRSLQSSAASKSVALGFAIRYMLWLSRGNAALEAEIDRAKRVLEDSTPQNGDAQKKDDA